MSNVAFKKDIHNEKTLYKFMSNIQNTKNLKLLYILTYADINGVGDDMFNSFNSKLLKDLYLSALEISVHSDRITDATKRLNIEKRLKNQTEFKTLSKPLQTKVLSIESNLFFFKHSPKDIIEIAKTAHNIKEYEYKIDKSSSLIIEIYRKIPLNVGYLLAKLSHLDVGSMEIVTLFNDVKYFKIEFVKSILKDDEADIVRVIQNAFDMSLHIETVF